MARYLVTGGAGFIGSNICDELVARGDEVRVLDDLSTGKRENLTHLGDKVSLVVGDIRDSALLAKMVEGCDFVLHQAAMASVPRSVAEPLLCDEINVHGTLQVLLAAKEAGAKRVVVASSCAIYGDDPELPKRETLRPWPTSPYAVSKLATEQYARVASDLLGIEAVALRYFNVFGPRQDPKGDYAAVVPKFLERLIVGEAPIIFGDGVQTRDFVFVGDVVRANLAACHSPKAAGQVCNVAGGTSYSITELANMVAEALDSDLGPIYEPARPGDILHSTADISHTMDRLGWKPQVGLVEGLRMTAQAMRSSK
jgi:UDP-glucose 4-epimerase